VAEKYKIITATTNQEAGEVESLRERQSFPSRRAVEFRISNHMFLPQATAPSTLFKLANLNQGVADDRIK
jgi:hypothetical protein